MLDLVKNVPLLTSDDPENIFEFLIQLKEVHDLKLASDFEMLSLTVGRTHGRVAQIVGTYLVGTPDWKIFCLEMMPAFFPPRTRERFLASYVLDHFQSPTNPYLKAIVAAADILGYQGQESEMACRIFKIFIRMLDLSSVF
jgi:hypothetical protein